MQPIDKGVLSRIIDALQLKATVTQADWSVHHDIDWSENVKAPRSAEEFAQETIWVICNSGMKNTVARLIYNRIFDAINNGLPVSYGFRHPGKAAAIQKIWDARETYYQAFFAAEDKLAFCASLPWIGGITKYHLAKNFGVDCAKPDVHLQRLANHLGTDTHTLCARLAAESGYRAATVDLILWRACATGVIDSRSGAMYLDPTEDGVVV